MAQIVCALLDEAATARLTAIATERSLKHILRARIMLLPGEYLTVQEVARQAGVSRPVMWRCRQPYGEEGVDALPHDKTRPPGKEPMTAGTIAHVLALAFSEPPVGAPTIPVERWLKVTGIALRSAHRIWQANRLQPHRIHTLRRSNDPAFPD